MSEDTATIYETIRLRFEDGIAILKLNRPDKMNALNVQMRAEMADAIRRAGERARVLVITGKGRGFCSGQDLGDRTGAAEIDLEQVLQKEYGPLIRGIHASPIPVIAAVNGPAAGAGANIALACDVVIAAESAYFMQVFSRIGLIPDAGGTYFLPRSVGLARAMGLALFGDKLPARKAAEWGLIWEAVPDEEFDAVWRARAKQLAEGPTQAYKRIRQALRASFDNDFETQYAFESRLQGEAGRTRDFKESVRAFLEKRKPRHEGR